LKIRLAVRAYGPSVGFSTTRNRASAFADHRLTRSILVEQTHRQETNASREWGYDRILCDFEHAFDGESSSILPFDIHSLDGGGW
jgi:hypothetical protein